MFPIRDDQQPTRTPMVTWALLALNVVVFAFQLGMPDWVLERFYLLYGIVPARITDPQWAWYNGFPGGGWLTFLTSLFIHGGWLHLLANMWTLWLFGDDVEDRLGPGRFLALYLGAGLVAGSVQVLLFPGMTMPTIGASGAVAGVMGAFLLLFPLARIDILVPVFFFFFVWQVPAVFYLPFWFLGEVLSGTLALAVPTFSNVAFWAHVGGFLTGLALVQHLRPEPPVRRARPVEIIHGPGFVILPGR